MKTLSSMLTIAGFLAWAIAALSPVGSRPFSPFDWVGVMGVSAFFLGSGLLMGYARKETNKPEKKSLLGDRGQLQFERWLSNDPIFRRELVLWAALANIPEIGRSGVQFIRKQLTLVHPTGDVDFMTLRQVIDTYKIEPHRLAAELYAHELFFRENDVTYIDDGFAQSWPSSFDELHRLLKNKKQDKE